MLEERAAQWKDDYIRQGILIGELKGIGLALQDLLSARFGTVPRSVTACILRASDPDALRKLVRSACCAESLQAFIDQMETDDTGPMSL